MSFDRKVFFSFSVLGSAARAPHVLPPIPDSRTHGNSSGLGLDLLLLHRRACLLPLGALLEPDLLQVREQGLRQEGSLRLAIQFGLLALLGTLGIVEDPDSTNYRDELLRTFECT